jgi:hypothetical protein
MPLPRLQLFEFNDAPWAPAVLREALISALSEALDRGGLLDELVEPFSRFLDDTAADAVLDLASGAGGPASAFARALSSRGREVHFTLSDLTPRRQAWEALARRWPARFDFIEAPVDATAPAPLRPGLPRVIINALHHFPPALARRALLGAAEGAPGVFIAEGLVRNPLRFAAMGRPGLRALLAGPWRARHHRLQHAAFTWLTPAALLASVWDGSVSALRCYDEAQLRDFVAPLGPGWRWTFGEYRYGGFGRGSWFSGVRTPPPR